MYIPEITEIKRDISKNISLFIYGDSMVGKTTLTSTFPKPLVFNTDGNVNSIKTEVISLLKEQDASYKNNAGSLVRERTSKWKLFQYYVKNFQDVGFVEQIKKAGFETIVLDVLDHLYDWCREQHLEDKGFKDESEDKFWAVSTEIKKDFRDTISNFIEAVKLNFNLVLTGFEGIKEYKEGLETKNMFVPSLRMKVENGKGEDRNSVIQSIISRIDMFGVVKVIQKKSEDKTTDFRILFVNSSSNYFAGNRYEINKPLKVDYASIKEAIERKNNNV